MRKSYKTSPQTSAASTPSPCAPFAPRLIARGIDLDQPWADVLTLLPSRARDGLVAKKLVTLRQVIESFTYEVGRNDPAISARPWREVISIPLSLRVERAIERENISTMGQLLEAVRGGRFAASDNFGRTSIRDLYAAVRPYLPGMEALLPAEVPDIDPAIAGLPWREVIHVPLSVRIERAIERENILTIGELITAVSGGRFAAGNNFGRTSIRDLRAAVQPFLPNAEPTPEVTDQGRESTQHDLSPALLRQGADAEKILDQSGGHAPSRPVTKPFANTVETSQASQQPDLSAPLSNFASGSRKAIVDALEMIAEHGLEYYWHGSGELLDTIDKLIDAALISLKPTDRTLTSERILDGITLEKLAQTRGISRERVRQIVRDVLDALQRRFARTARTLIAPLLTELDTHGPFLDSVIVEELSPGITLPQFRFALALTGRDDFRTWRERFLTNLSSDRLKDLLREVDDLIGTARGTTVTVASLTTRLSEKIGFEPRPATLRSLLYTVFNLEADEDGRLVLEDQTLGDALARVLAAAGEPLHVAEITRRYYGPQEDPALDTLRRERAIRPLSTHEDVFLCGKGTYVHRAALRLTDKELDEIIYWCVERISGCKDGIETKDLLQQMNAAGRDTSKLNPFLLRALLPRHPSVQGLRKNAVAWAPTFRPESRTLAARFPEIAKDWHPTRNGELQADHVFAKASRRAWWRCRIHPACEWEATVLNQTAKLSSCPLCGGAWTLNKIRNFVASLADHLKTLTPAELYVIFQQNGLLTQQSRCRTLMRALATGRFPAEEVSKFVKGESSLADHLLDDPKQTLEAFQAIDGPEDVQPPLDNPPHAGLENVVSLVPAEGIELEGEPDGVDNLPRINTLQVLASLQTAALSSADHEAAEFLLASAAAKIWKHAFRDESEAVSQAEGFHDDNYAGRARDRFLEQHRAARELQIPPGYAFTVNGIPAAPNLMQRFVATSVRDRRRVGNWSGAGAGKTLSAVLASRVVAAGLTVICCPNAVVAGWASTITAVYPDSIVVAKTFNPDWGAAIDDPTGLALAGRHRYLVLNYEMFQQSWSAASIQNLLAREHISFIVVDEIHYAKQRKLDDMSRRRRLVGDLIALAGNRDPNVCVLGMSATPVINNLQEGKSLVEMVTGVAQDDLSTQPSLENCMSLHQRLVTFGIRWIPEYALEYDEQRVYIDCGQYVDEIRALGQHGNPLALEQILTRARLETILEHVRPKTLIYTHFIDAIDRVLRDALVAKGWRVGFCTGEDKSGLLGFIEGNLDVLIGSSAIGTGVDGLQRVCSRLIVNVLPWTNAEFEQLKGRLYRQGQHAERVTLVLPLTHAYVRGERWSWCESKMQRLQFKKSIADAAVDGIVPEEHLRTPAQAYQDVIGWLRRLDDGEVEMRSRPRISVTLSDGDSAVEARLRRYGDFATMNSAWNHGRSDATHQRLEGNPEEWAQYHDLFRKAREAWAVVPCDEMIHWCEARSGLVIGDFGCGEAALARAVGDRHTVYSFDHVALDDGIVSCDIAHVPLGDNELDVAVFSLSLMGQNFAEYLREAHRTLKLDGHLHIYEATSRFRDREVFVRSLEALGFERFKVEEAWVFTHIEMLRSSRPIRTELPLVF